MTEEGSVWRLAASSDRKGRGPSPRGICPGHFSSDAAPEKEAAWEEGLFIPAAVIAFGRLFYVCDTCDNIFCRSLESVVAGVLASLMQYILMLL